MTDRVSFMRRVWAALDSWLVVALLAASLALNVFLALPYHRSRAASSPDMAVGQKVPILKVREIGGANAIIDWASDARPTFVYIFSPSCVWCNRNLQNIKALSETRGAAYRFIGLSISDSGLKKYVEENELKFPVFTSPADVRGREVKLHATPQTIVISPDGRVQEAWLGAYTGRVQAEIERKLGVSLPGIPSVSASSSVTHTAY